LANGYTQPQAARQRPRRLIKNALFSSWEWGTTLLLAAVCIPYMVRRLTVEGFGIYTLFSGLIGYYALLDLGLGQGLVRFVSDYRARQDDEGISASINAALCIQAIAGLTASALLVLFADPILGWLRIPSSFWTAAQSALRASAVGFFFTMMSGTFSSVLMGLQRYDITSKVNVSTNTCLTLSIVAILFFGGGLLAVMCATAISAVVVFTIYLIVVRRMLPTWRPAFQVNWTLLRSLLGFSFFLFVSRTSQSFATYFMRFIVSAMLGPSAVTYYSVPMKIVIAFGGFLSSSAATLFPFASEMNAQGSGEALRRVYLLASKYFVSLAVPVFALMGIFSRQILSLWMGSDFAARASAPMVILCFGAVIGSTGTISGLVALGVGRSRLLASFSLVSIALAASLAVPLIRAADVSGAAAAYLVAGLVWVAFQCYVAKSVFGLLVSAYFNQVYRFHALAIVPLVGAALLYQKLLGSLGSRGAFSAAVGGAILLSGYYGVSVLSRWTDVAELRRLVGVKAG